MRRHILALLVLALTTLTPRTGLAQSSVPTEVRAAHEFLFAVYPDLLRQPLAVQLKPDGAGGWLVSVAEAPATPTRPGDPITAPPSGEVLVRGSLKFDATGTIERFTATGPYLYDGANAVLRDAVRTHPQWIDSDVDVELTRMGGGAIYGRRFVPAAAAESPGVGRHLGTNVAVAAPRFALREAPPGTSNPAQIRTAWIVEAVATAAGQPVQYQLTYELFGGRLVSVTRVGGAQ